MDTTAGSELTISVQRKVVATAMEFRWIIGPPLLLLVFILLHPLFDAIGSRIAAVIGGGAHDLILTKQFQGFDGFRYMKLDWPEFTSLFATHLTLVIESVAWALVAAIPIGLLLHRVRLLVLPVFALLDGIYTIPSLAVFPILILTPGFGVSDKSVIVVVVAYAQFILVRNVYAGLESVPSEVKEAARGMGMSRLQILLHIEFPLALPVIVAGIRIATVAAIGICSIGALTGIADLGHFLFAPAASGGVNATAEIEAGVTGVVVLAFGADIVLRLVERWMPASRVNSARGAMRIFGRGGRLQSFGWRLIRH